MREIKMSSTNVEKEAIVVSGERQLKKFGQFLEQHQQILNGLCYHDDSLQHSSTASISHEQFGPIRLEYALRNENISYFKLIESDNKVLNKILIVFAQLCDYAHELTVKSELFIRNFLFHDEDLTDFSGEETPGYANVIKISQMLTFLFELKHFLNRCLIISDNIIAQLAALFELEKAYVHFQSSIHFQCVLSRLSEVIRILVVFDEILPNSNIIHNWSMYKKSVKSVEQNLDRFNSKYERTSIVGLKTVLNELEEMFSGHLLQDATEQYSKVKNEISGRAFVLFTAHFQSYIKFVISDIARFPNELSEFDDTSTIIKINAMTVVYHNMFGNLDSKTLKSLIELNIKYCSITLAGNIIWCPAPFIQKHALTLLKGFEKFVNDTKRVQQSYLTQKTQSLIKDTQSYCIQVSSWILQFTETLKRGCHRLKIDELRQRLTLILQGVQFAGQISHIIKSVTNLHVLLKVTMQKKCLLSICKLIEFLKLICLAFERNVNYIVDTIACITQFLQYQVLLIIANSKKKMSQDTTYSERSLDILSALQVAEKCLFGPATLQRITVTRLALSMADPTKTFHAEHLQKVEKNISRLESIIGLQETIGKFSESSFLYWHQSLLPIYLKSIMDSSSDLLRVTYILNSAEDCSSVYKKFDGTEFECIRNFNETLSEDFKQTIIHKICTHIETYLRLDFHSNLQVTPIDPFTNKDALDYRRLIRMKPIQMGRHHVVIKDHIEHYLSKMFYNLTTISLHDWRTYGEMRRIAATKFNLTTVEDHLPTQTLEQGLDVLEIMRNIHVFVSKYLYNLNNQIFIEQSSNNKHLNTINIRHIANSLRTHGTGIINTTVNFTYQFLRKKFYIFSQFMFDEHIKSRLIKDLKYFRDNREKNNEMYSFERADAFNKGIRKLGLSPIGQSYLDLFRQLITHIGNAMGYVRMIRSGGLHSCSNASVYLPNLDVDLMFSDMCREQNLSVITADAAENLEFDIKNLAKSYTEGTDYFKLLVEAFAPFFRNPRNSHLRNFYLIVPPLTLNFIDHILTSKDKMTKKNKDGALFTDDGFAMGLAFILKLLDQMTDFNSLRWFKEIRAKYDKERTAVRQQKEKLDAAGDDKLLQTLVLTEKRILKIQQEYDLLYFNLSSAKIFFK